MARLDPTGVSRILSYIKNWVTTALGGKANSSHNHTKSQITDFPTIPSKVSQLTNDSGYITSSGSCNYANSAGAVAWGNVSGKPSSYTPSSHNHDSVYLKLSGGTITGNISKNNTSVSWFQGRNAAPFRTIAASSPGDNQYVPCWSAKSYQGSWDCGPYTSNVLHLSYITDANYNSGSNVQTADFTFATDGTFNAKVLKQNGTAVSLSGHTHTKSQITDFPTIPSKTSQLTNDSGFITGVAWNNVSGKPSTFAPSSHIHTTMEGTYSGNGGKQGPGYYGKNRVGFLMSNESVNGDSCYKNWLYMDNYSADDVGGATAIGVDRMHAKAFIMQSSAARSAWSESAELLSSRHLSTAMGTVSFRIIRNGITSPGWYSDGVNSSVLQVCTQDNTEPSICLHRSGYSHIVLAEKGGQFGVHAQGGAFDRCNTESNTVLNGYRIYVG